MNYAFETACKAFTMPEAAQSIDGLNRCAKAMAILAGKAGIYGMIGGTDSGYGSGRAAGGAGDTGKRSFTSMSRKPRP